MRRLRWEKLTSFIVGAASARTPYRRRFANLKSSKCTVTSWMLDFFLSPRFITAASDGDMDAVKAYLKDGLDVNSQDWDKLTALVAAASQGHIAVVKLLLDKASITRFIATPAIMMTLLVKVSPSSAANEVKAANLLSVASLVDGGRCFLEYCEGETLRAHHLCSALVNELVPFESVA